MTDRYCVIGNPVAHSKSPWIHAEFARLTKQSMSYEAQLCPVDEFNNVARDFFAAGGLGCNITVPFKENAWQLAEVRSRRAEKAGAVNTLLKGKDGRLYGDNTDGVGLVRDLLQNANYSLKNRRVLMLGAGGAVRGVLGPLLAEQPAELVLANRSHEKAERLVSVFSEDGLIQALPFSDLTGKKFDLIINGTSASLQGDLPPLPADIFVDGALAYDMMYGADPTIFMSWAAATGTEVRDGLGMLVEQAAEAFFIWRQQRPPTASVLNALRASLIKLDRS
jgi:shikimate dehydrogenase